MLFVDNRLEAVGARRWGRRGGVAWAIVPCVMLALATACSRPDLGAAEPKKVLGKATSSKPVLGHSSTVLGDSAKPLARSPSDTTIEDLLKGQTEFCTGVPVPAATMTPDTALASAPAATPVYCPFPK